MLKMNQKMQKILKQKGGMNKKTIVAICEDIVSQVKCINDCVLYDENGNLEQKKINWSIVLKVNKDFTGYEVSHNEILLPNELFNESLLIFLDEIKFQLLKKFPNRKFCIILSDSDRAVLRFHTYRPQEGLWLSQDLEKYKAPILFDVC